MSHKKSEVRGSFDGQGNGIDHLSDFKPDLIIAVGTAILHYQRYAHSHGILTKWCHYPWGQL